MRLALLLLTTLLAVAPAQAQDVQRLLGQHPTLAGADWERVEEIVIELRDHNYHPDELSLTLGRPYKLVLRNVGGSSHDMVGGTFFDRGVIALRWVSSLVGRITAGQIESVYLRPKHDTELWLVPLREGEFTFVCSLPGHSEAGMEGVIRVVR